ncbi:MAG: 50S ribosomal protein L24 [Desulfobacterales bacterium]|jgi:large subunit ribosomal protein L24|nr:50S ribosomal protein L24 [Desulfobacterales bacterium]
MEKQDCLIKKNDKVKVIAGKDKGKIGRVLSVDRKKNRLMVEHVNIAKRHTRPSAKNKQGGIVEGEAPIHCSNALLMCNKCMAPARIKMRHLEDGKKVRVCRKCDELIDA